MLIAYRIFDRPDFAESSRTIASRCATGSSSRFAGAALIVVGGLSRRRDELAAEDAARGRSDDGSKARPENKAGE